MANLQDLRRVAKFPRIYALMYSTFALNLVSPLAPLRGPGVGLAAALGPLPLELCLQDLCAPLARQPRLLQAQFAHAHVVLARHQQDRPSV